MVVEAPNRRSRRALLGAGLGAMAAAVAGMISRPAATEAANDHPILLGKSNSASAPTIIWNSKSPGLSVQCDVGYGIEGNSKGGPGVSGVSGSPGQGAVQAEHVKHGFGVWATSNAGALGHGSDGAGVLADNTANGVALWARAWHGIAVFANAAYPNAVALKADGVTQFARSGTLTVAATTDRVTKTGIRIDAETLVLAVLMDHRPGVHVEAATPLPRGGRGTGDSFTIFLSTTVDTDTRVAWFLVN